MKKLFKIFLFLCLIGIVIVAWCSHIVVKSSRGKIFDNVNDIPKNNVGLLLGTSPLGRTGRPNVYYVNRIKATVDLYKAGKIKVVLISGDNHHKSYNEPQYMKNDLVSKGIPDSCIVLDYAGFRTFDSMIRAQKVFGQDSITVISQKFHNQRALYICNHLGISAVAFNAKNTISRIWRIRMYFREKLARTKAVLDILFGKKPHFLGDPIPITIPKDTIIQKDTTIKKPAGDSTMKKLTADTTAKKPAADTTSNYSKKSNSSPI
ncbi:MAG: YdcF family protein [Bacteroidales bacterium]|nr:YdcF family protein [Bacteroidales bacterium]